MDEPEDDDTLDQPIDDEPGTAVEVSEPDDDRDGELADLLSDLDDDEVSWLGEVAEDQYEGVGRAMSRFDRLSAELAKRGAKNPDALSAWIGRRKYSRAGFAALAAAGRAKKKAKGKAMRSTSVPGGPMYYQHFRPLEGIEISRAHTDGRTVVAYASYFDTPYPVSDQYGDYDEVVTRSAFAKWLSEGGVTRAMCLFNHGFTVHGTPSDAYSVPLGVPLEIKPDGKGLVTVTRYNEGPDVDRVLEAIRNGAITGQSFRGKVIKSTPAGRQYRPGRDGKRVTVTRHELTLTDYGPTPVPVNPSAGILMVRSVLAGLAEEQRAELLRNPVHVPTTPEPEPVDEPPAAEEPEEQTTALPPEEVGAAEPVDEIDHSGRQQPDTARSLSAADIRARARMELILRSGHTRGGK